MSSIKSAHSQSDDSPTDACEKGYGTSGSGSTNDVSTSSLQQQTSQPKVEESPRQFSIQSVRELDWEGSDDPANPQNWSKAKKAYHTWIPASIALVCTIGSSIITPGLDDIQRKLGVSAEVSLLPYVLYLYGFSFGPLLSGPCSEALGRRAVYLISMPIFALFILGAGFSQNIASLAICRFFAGFFGSPGLSIGGATLGDIWLPHQRAIPWAIYVTTPYLGPAIGPLVGGYVTLSKGWRWTQWTLLFFTVAGLLPTIGMKETYKPIILRRRAKARGITVEEAKFPSIQDFVTKLVTRPIHMALVEPVVGLFTLYIAINFGMTYAFFAAFPYVFAKAYGFGIGPTGLTFLGLGIGSLVACGIMILFSRFVFRRHTARSREQGQGGKVDPEKRLYLAMIGSICLPISLFWFGWSVHARVHWICPVVAEGVFACGNLLIFMAATLYMIDTYGPLYGASANSATSMARYLLAGVFPLFIVQMYKELGIGWASSLLGFVSLLLTPIPWVFYFTGPRLRAKSRYEK